MSVTSAFEYSIRLIADRPIVLLPAIVAIFFTTVVVHAVLSALFITNPHAMASLRLDLLLIELVVSVLVGIYLHAFYVGVAEHYNKGRVNLKKAYDEVNRHKGQVGLLGIAIHIINGILAGIMVLSLYLVYYYFGIHGHIGLILIGVALLSFMFFVYLSVLFFEINVAIIVENLHGIKAILRSIAMGRRNMSTIFTTIVILGCLYLAVYGSINLTIRNYTGIWHTVLVYLSIIPYSIVTILFDLMAPAIYYKQIKRVPAKAQR